MCIADSGVANVRSDQTFRMLVANFSDRSITLLPDQIVATASTNAENLFQSHLSHADVFGWIHEDRNTKFRKPHMSAYDIETINTHLADRREKQIGEDEKLLTDQNIVIDVPKDKEDNFQAMLKKHHRVWDG